MALGVCVDDFGLHPAIDEAALRLVDQGRVSALSCMTRVAGWRAAAPALAWAARQADVGLHLDFTEAGALGPRRGLGGFILAAYGRRLEKALLRDEIGAQLDAFEDARGAAPDFVDGHQHVHQLPVVRNALLAELLRRYGAQLPWLRDTRPRAGVPAGPGAERCKQQLIAALGARRLRALARAGGFRLNAHLLGVYGFDGTTADYAQRLARWCAQAGHGDLLMCHPAAAAPPGDSIATARVAEYAVLGSDVFPRLLRGQGLQVARLSQVLSAQPQAAATKPAG